VENARPSEESIIALNKLIACLQDADQGYEALRSVHLCMEHSQSRQLF